MARISRKPAPDAFLKACPSRLVLSRIGEKWTLMAVVALADNPLRFGELLRRLEGVSQKMLSQTLRNLNRDGLLRRTAYDVMPLRVEYALTPMGQSLVPLACSLKAWAEQNLARIETGNRRYDALSSSRAR
jgi:DNA-binding HxlR family transcriptional regulator